MSFLMVILLGLCLVWIVDRRFFNRKIKFKAGFNTFDIAELLLVSLSVGIGMLVLAGLVLEQVFGLFVY